MCSFYNGRVFREARGTKKVKVAEQKENITICSYEAHKILRAEG